MSPLELVAAITGAISVWLSVRQNIWSWPTAIVNVVLYALVFWDAKLYADMGLQVIYAVLSLYGWYQWLYGGEGRTELRVTRTAPRLGALLTVIAAAGSAVLGALLRHTTDAALPFMDSFLSSTSLVAQWMMTTNTNDARFAEPASWYADAGATLRLRGQSVLVQLRNLFDRRVYTGGYPGAAANSSDPSAMEPYYYTLAPRNLTVSARLAF